jgi:hypothetical protein
MTSPYPRGSEWRRWDVHVHTPGTLMNDQFGDWEEYLKAIEAQDQVRVMGVTDYLSIRGYSTLKKHKEAGRIPNIDLLIPNIEFRFAPPSDKGTAVNIHLLVSPEDPEHEKRIQEALLRLSWKYKDGTYSCAPDQLAAFGKAFDPSILAENAALEKGVEQFKIDFTKFREWFDGEAWLKQNSLVAVSAGDDGLSGFLKQGGWAAHREEITRFSHMLFCGRPGEQEFWLGQGNEEEQKTVKHLGGPRPCLHGSDAHDIARLFKPDLDRFCWIKADPTFEGLRQVLYEPADRVHIGPTAPVYHDEARIIRSIRLSKSGGWFEDVEIPLNAGLVSIIGQKGSGKSALAEVAAHTAGSWETEDPGSFIKRAGAHLADLGVTLVWADGHTTNGRLGDGQTDAREVRYLSQKFVERLCAEDHVGGELVREIENVVFTYVDPTDTLNASDFAELRAMRTEAIRAESERLRQDVGRLIREERALRDNAAKLPDKRNRIKALTEERDGLVKQMPKAANEAEAKMQADLQAKRASLATLQQTIAADKQRLQRIADIRARVQAFGSQMTRFANDLTPMLDEAGIPHDERAPFRPAFPGDTEQPLLKRAAALQAAIAKNEGALENPAENTLRWLNAQIKALVDKESADKARQERIRVLQTRIAAIGSELERINTEIAQIEGPEKARMAAAYDERLITYVDYFRNLKEEQKTLEQLYGPVKKHLNSESASPPEQELEFSIRWEADLAAWLERGTTLFDQRRTIPYGTFADLAAAAANLLVPAWTSGDATKIKPALESFLSEFKKKELPPREYLRSGVTLEQLLLWLYDLEHIRLSYGLKYNGVELEKLSPGTKGIVLLILYLGMDVGDTRPLIVDQPDENLDNESIFQLLTAYFKAAKTRRQIILITHNPNLVVNADSEQVIVAHCDRRPNGLPYITYHSGSLENRTPPNKGIKQQVCRILEGGSDAFLRRERRYELAK